jgi:hypothetical protein
MGTVALDVGVDVAIEVRDVEQLLEVVSGDLRLTFEGVLRIVQVIGTGRTLWLSTFGLSTPSLSTNRLSTIRLRTFRLGDLGIRLAGTATADPRLLRGPLRTTFLGSIV